MTGALADRLFEGVGMFFRKIAPENGLGLAMDGRHTTMTHGPAHAHTVFGWRGETSVAIVFGIPDAWALTGRGYLLWFTQPGGSAVDLANLPVPAGEQIASSPEDVERYVRRGLQWLASHPYAEVEASFYRDCLEGGAPRGAA